MYTFALPGDLTIAERQHICQAKKCAWGFSIGGVLTPTDYMSIAAAGMCLELLAGDRRPALPSKHSSSGED